MELGDGARRRAAIREHMIVGDEHARRDEEAGPVAEETKDRPRAKPAPIRATARAAIVPRSR